MEDIKNKSEELYLDTFLVRGFEIPAWNVLDKKECNGEYLNPIEKFLFNNESANNKEANEQRKNLKEIIEYILDNNTI
jgi:hypothetical protein